jgi:hypothetical protein
MKTWTSILFRSFVLFLLLLLLLVVQYWRIYLTNFAVKMHSCYHEWKWVPQERGPEILSLEHENVLNAKCTLASLSPGLIFLLEMLDLQKPLTIYTELIHTEPKHLVCSVNGFISNSFSAILKNCSVFFLFYRPPSTLFLLPLQSRWRAFSSLKNNFSFLLLASKMKCFTETR